MRNWYRQRYLDLLGSIYIYNEHRGYTAIDRVLAAVRARWPDDERLIARIEKHRADERKHYLMFRRWFERRGTTPLAIDRTCGHIDRFVGIMFGSTIDDLEPQRVIGRDDLFERMCRVISPDRATRPSAGRNPPSPPHRPVGLAADEDFPDYRTRRAEPLGSL